MPERYQEEIEEILRRAEEATPPGPARGSEKNARNVSNLSRRANRPYRLSAGGVHWLYLSPGKIALAGFVLLLVGALWINLLIWVGLGLLVLAYLLFFVKPGSLSYEKRWRGRMVETQPSPWQRFLRWLKS
jgi:hypothetical protein